MTAPAGTAVQPARQVTPWHFVRLKLRVMGNNFRGQRWRIALYVIGLLFGLWFAAMGFLGFAAPGLADRADIAMLVAALGGAVLVLGWLFLPLVFFGVDETLDPARFALLPLRRRTLIPGMLAAALVGVPALCLLLATVGLVVSAWALGGVPAGLVAVVGMVLGLVLCVAVSRAVTSAFATMLRSRRMRDLAAVALAVLAALLGPLQIAVISAVERADWDRFTGPATVLGWTPLAAPYTAGLDVAAGRAWAAPLKLLITIAAIGLLLWWWSRSVESAMIGAAGGSAGATRKGTAGSPVEQLFPRVLGRLARNRYGALVAREARYWWRDMRRRAGLITFAMVGIFLPVMLNIRSLGFAGKGGTEEPSPVVLGLSMLFVGVLAAVSLANQFGYDGSAYAANVIAGVPGRQELRARVTAFSLYIVPLLVLIPVVVGLLLGEPGWIGMVAGTVFAAYGAGLAVNLYVSIFGAYELPETSNPFAMNSGAGVAKSFLSFLAMAASAVLALPMVVANALLGDVWLWLALPVGLAYGLGAIVLGTYLAGDVLDRRMPELLQAVTPRR
ncbi:ABC transporter permease [Plantactinospora sp. GCM10030261]|uniref:ABC transporter permease n=1 Tax=Plantactinospora sp. GCM10030261 TaxID=3273420 RepID=UPI0036087DA7